MKKSPRADTDTSSEDRILQVWHIFFNLNSQELAMFGVSSWSKEDNEEKALGDISKGTRGLDCIAEVSKYVTCSSL